MTQIQQEFRIPAPGLSRCWRVLNPSQCLRQSNLQSDYSLSISSLTICTISHGSWEKTIKFCPRNAWRLLLSNGLKNTLFGDELKKKLSSPDANGLQDTREQLLVLVRHGSTQSSYMFPVSHNVNVYSIHVDDFISVVSSGHHNLDWQKAGNECVCKCSIDRTSRQRYVTIVGPMSL